MYQVTSTVGSRADAERAGRIFGAMADAWDAPGEESPTTAGPATADRASRRSRKPADAAPAAATDSKPDPVALYGTLTGQAPAETPAVVATSAPESVQPEAVPSLTPAEAKQFMADLAPAKDTRSRDELLAALREEGHKRGALWIRPFLAEYKAGRFADLTDDQIRAVLAKAALEDVMS